MKAIAVLVRPALSGIGRFLLFLCLLASLAAPAQAAVEITFYSKEFGATFPHAYIGLRGSLDRSGEKIDANYGFTATRVSPAILFGSVEGEIVSVDDAYVADSDTHFAFTLSDSEYDRVMAMVERWRTLQQPSYNLNRQNCVFFVAYIAETLGMKADTPKGLMKKPRSYVEFLMRTNRDWLEQRGARFLR